MKLTGKLKEKNESKGETKDTAKKPRTELSEEELNYVSGGTSTPSDLSNAVSYNLDPFNNM